MKDLQLVIVIIGGRVKCFCLTLGIRKDGHSPFLLRIVLVSAVKQKRKYKAYRYRRKKN